MSGKNLRMMGRKRMRRGFEEETKRVGPPVA